MFSLRQKLRRPKPARHVTIGGRYRLRRWLGIGGMGRVAEAVDLETGERVAVKLPTAEVLRSAEGRARFLRESRLGALVRNEHVVALLDAGVDPKRGPFCVMEYVDGGSLADVVGGHGLNLAAALEILAQLASGLESVHAAKIVHRDVKPENVLIAQRKNGTLAVKLADFGVAKSSAGDGGSLLSTQPGTIVGSLLYMSPERLAASAQASAASDVWSYGVVMFVTLTGRVPFRAEGDLGLVDAIKHGRPRRLADGGADVPSWLESLVLRCLEKRPELRPEMSVLRRQLQAHRSSAPIVLPTPERGVAALLERTTVARPAQPPVVRDANLDERASRFETPRTRRDPA